MDWIGCLAITNNSESEAKKLLGIGHLLDEEPAVVLPAGGHDDLLLAEEAQLRQEPDEGREVQLRGGLSVHPKQWRAVRNRSRAEVGF